MDSPERGAGAPSSGGRSRPPRKLAAVGLFLLLAWGEFSNEIGLAIQSFVSKTANSLMNYLSNVILNFATYYFKIIVILFTFFFFLRDREEIVNYIQSLLPFSKEVEKRLFKSSKDLTISILYGQVLLGIIEGIIAGIGFFIFGVPNALLLTILAAIAGIFPIIGTAIVWVPVAIYLIYCRKSSNCIRSNFIWINFFIH